jgi:hypothetical protein
MGGFGGSTRVPLRAPSTTARIPSPSFASTPSGAGSLLAGNSARGNAFQTAATKAFNLPKNTTTLAGTTKSGALQATIPDVYAGGQAPIADIKDLLKISDTPQLQAQAEVAKATGTSFSVITGPRNLQISQPIADVVQNSGGFIFRVDPLTSTVEVWDSASRFWVPFLGGNW